VGVYARLDDAFYGHGKVLNASFEALGLYAVALSYCAQQLTDGALSAGALGLLARGRRDIVDELVALGLWERDLTTDSVTYRVHDYLDVNRSGAQIRRERHATAQRVAQHRMHQGNAVSNTVGNAECTGLEKPARAPSRALRQNLKKSTLTTPRLSADATSKRNADADFGAFWVQYPRKVGKPEAHKAWRQVAEARPPLATLLAGLDRQRCGEQWRESPRFIPHPATWLRRHGWLDETPEQIVAAKRAPSPVANIPNEKPLRTAGEVANVAEILDVLPWRRK